MTLMLTSTPTLTRKKKMKTSTRPTMRTTTTTKKTRRKKRGCLKGLLDDVEDGFCDGHRARNW